jgi:hypothetical protein
MRALARTEGPNAIGEPILKSGLLESRLKTMPQWIFTLNGEIRDLEDLPNRFSTPACSIVDAQGSYHLTSTELNQITEPTEALEKAQNLLAMMRSTIELRLGFVSKIDISGVTRIEQDGRRTGFIFPSSIASSARVFIPTLFAAGTAPPPTPARATESDIAIATRDPKVAKAFRIFGSRPHTWHSLNNVLEVIQSDVGGQITKTGWATKTELLRFTQTALT